MTDQQKGFIFAFIALFLWGIHGPAGRYLALHHVDMRFVFTMRFWIGTLILFFFLAQQKKLRLNWKDRWPLVLSIALIGVAGNSYVYHLALNYLPATLVMILENLSPIFVLLMSFLLYRIRPTFIQIFTFLLSFVGLLFIMLGKNQFADLHPQFNFGVLLGIITGCTFGFYTFFSGVLVKPLRGNPIAIIQFLFKIFLVSSLLSLPILFQSQSFPHNGKEWFWLIEMGIFQSGLAYIFWNYALAYLPTNTVSILFFLTIVFTTINEVLFLHLQLNLPLVAGGFLICYSGYLLQKKSKSGRNEASLKEKRSSKVDRPRSCKDSIS